MTIQKEEKTPRVIRIKRKSRGISADYAVFLYNDDLAWVRKIIVGFGNSMLEGNESNQIEMFKSAHMGNVRDADGKLRQKTWWDLYIGLNTKMHRVQPTGEPEDFSIPQLEYFNRMLKHFGLATIQFLEVADDDFVFEPVEVK